MAQPKIVLLDDIDIWDRGDVEKIINVREERTFARDKLINNEFSINVKNFDNFYSVDNNTSYFKNVRWRYKSLKIYNPNGDIIWDGIIRSITRNYETGLATIRTISSLHKQWNKRITYTSSAAETPATAAKNIMDNYSISYDSKTIQDSINKLDDESCYVKVKILEEDDVTVMAAIEKLAEYACADAYSHLNKVYFKHWQLFTGGVKVSLTDSDFKVRPTISDLESEIINDFSISYDGFNGVPITDANADNIGNVSRQDLFYGTHTLPGFDDGMEEAQVYFTSLAGATYIGECYIRRTHINLSSQPRPPYAMDFELKGTHEDWIDLETYFQLTFAEESWTNKVFEFFRTEINYNTDSIKLRAIETQV